MHSTDKTLNTQAGMLAFWQASRLSLWLAGCLVVWLAGWLARMASIWLAGRLVGKQADMQIDRIQLAGWQQQPGRRAGGGQLKH